MGDGVSVPGVLPCGFQSTPNVRSVGWTILCSQSRAFSTPPWTAEVFPFLRWAGEEEMRKSLGGHGALALMGLAPLMKRFRQ